MKRAAILLVALALAACSSSLDKARVTLTTAVRIEADISDGMLPVVRVKQSQILAQYSAGQLSKEDAQAEYDAFRKQVDGVSTALETLYHAIAAAAHALDAAEAAKSSAAPAAPLADVAAAMAEVMKVLAAAGIHIPGVQ